MLHRTRSPVATSSILDRPGTRSSVGTYVNFLVACTVLASAALSGVLVAFGGKHREKASSPAREPDRAATEPAATEPAATGRRAGGEEP